jgi:hypothetical protein
VDHDESETPLDDSLRDALAELEDYIDGVPVERLPELVLPFASRWVLPDVGLDLPRLREEADTLVQASPLSDRIVSGYVDHVAYWVSQRMLVDVENQPQPALAATQLDAARTLLAERAALVSDEGFPRIAAGIQRALDESSGGKPPDDRVWSALALRIAESVLP